MKEVILATRNAGKAKEFVRLFSELGWTVKTLLDYDNIPDVEETGETFEENARIKAETVSSLLNAAVLADDSGLEIDALDGRPGVYSARYAGAEKNDEANIEKVLQELKNVPPEKRTARFRCVLAFAAPGEKTRFFSGTCEGKILTEKRGSNGFGYDPIFYVEEKGKTMAEMDPGEKNQISHRADAVRKLKDWLQNGYPEVREEK